MLSLVGATLAQTSALTDLARAYQYLSKETGDDSRKRYRTLTEILSSLHETVAKGEEVSFELGEIQRWLHANLPEVSDGVAQAWNAMTWKN